MTPEKHIPSPDFSNSYPANDYFGQVAYILAIFKSIDVAFYPEQINLLIRDSELRIANTFFNNFKGDFPPSSRLGALVQTIISQETYRVKTSDQVYKYSISILKSPTNQTVEESLTTSIDKQSEEIFGNEKQEYLEKITKYLFSHRTKTNDQKSSITKIRYQNREKMGNLVNEIAKKFPKAKETISLS